MPRQWTTRGSPAAAPLQTQEWSPTPARTQRAGGGGERRRPPVSAAAGAGGAGYGGRAQRLPQRSLAGYWRWPRPGTAGASEGGGIRALGQPQAQVRVQVRAGAADPRGLCRLESRSTLGRAVHAMQGSSQGRACAQRCRHSSRAGRARTQQGRHSSRAGRALKAAVRKPEQAIKFASVRGRVATTRSAHKMQWIECRQGPTKVETNKIATLGSLQHASRRLGPDSKQAPHTTGSKAGTLAHAQRISKPVRLSTHQQVCQAAAQTQTTGALDWQLAQQHQQQAARGISRPAPLRPPPGAHQ